MFSLPSFSCLFLSFHFFSLSFFFVIGAGLYGTGSVGLLCFSWTVQWAWGEPRDEGQGIVVDAWLVGFGCI